MINVNFAPSAVWVWILASSIVVRDIDEQQEIQNNRNQTR
jgi:hypothetical protein